jgi:DNA adenine methylase
MGEVTVMAKALLRYPGGKGRLARRIIERFPGHDLYLEPCCGGAAVFLHKPRAKIEVLTDTDILIVKMLRALRDEPQQVLANCARMDYTQEWLDRCRQDLSQHERTCDALVAAGKIFLHHATRSGSGKGKLAIWRKHIVDWYTPAASWVNKRKTLPGFAARLEGTIIEQMDCLDALCKWGQPGVGHQAPLGRVIYIDPPYLGTTQHGTLDHVALSKLLRSLAGSHRFITHYQSQEYNTMYPEWSRDDFMLGNQYSGQGTSGATTLRTETLYYCL